MPRPPLHEEAAPRPGSSGRGGRGASNVFIFLAVLQAVAEALGQAQSAQEYGYYTNPMGDIVITDLSKATQSLPRRQVYRFDGYLFMLGDDGFFSVDDRCVGCVIMGGMEVSI